MRRHALHQASLARCCRTRGSGHTAHNAPATYEWRTGHRIGGVTATTIFAGPGAGLGSELAEANGRVLRIWRENLTVVCWTCPRVVPCAEVRAVHPNCIGEPPPRLLPSIKRNQSALIVTQGIAVIQRTGLMRVQQIAAADYIDCSCR